MPNPYDETNYNWLFVVTLIVLVVIFVIAISDFAVVHALIHHSFGIAEIVPSYFFQVLYIIGIFDIDDVRGDNHNDFGIFGDSLSLLK